MSLALGPLMHASGQWSALGTLLGGGKVVLYGEPHVDMELVLDLLEREHVNACNLVGDASARPMLQALADHPGRWDLSELRLLGSGGSILSGDVKDALMDAIPSVLAIVEGIGSSESPAQAVALTTRERCSVGVADVRTEGRHDGRRRSDPASDRAGQRRGRSPRHAGTRAGRLPQGSRAQCSDVRGDRRRALVAARATWRRSTPTGRSTCWAGAPCASTRAARRSTRRKSRPC